MVKKLDDLVSINDMSKTDISLFRAYEIIVAHLQQNCSASMEESSNYFGTPDRCVKALHEVCTPVITIRSKIDHILKKVFPVSNTEDSRHRVSGMLTQGPIVINSLCPHHLYPVRYEAWVSYLPNYKVGVLGLSKLSRISKLLGKRPVLQEQLAEDISQVLCNKDTVGQFYFPQLNSEGSAVLLIGTHLCMACRGVHEDARTATLSLKGAFWGEGMEQKFYDSVAALRAAKPFK